MANNCKIVNKYISSLRKRLTQFAATVDPSSPDYQEELNRIKLEYLGLGAKVSEEEFNNIQQEILHTSTIKKEEDKAILQLQNPSLDFQNMSKLYLNASSTYGIMKHLFTSKMFKALFIDTTNYGEEGNKYVARIPQTGQDINQNIAKVKNELISNICNYFEIDLPTPIFEIRGKEIKVNGGAYKNILQDSKIVNFLQTINENLPTLSKEYALIHSSLFILNNFDSLVGEFLPKIISNDSSLAGDITHTQYVVETEGNAPSIWSSDDLSTYGSDLYASNLGKFILSNIQKVDSNLQPIEGSYMQSQDAFVLASLLREAETEYHVRKLSFPGHPYNPNLYFKNNLTEATEVLLQAGIEGQLESLKNFKKEIYPVYKWLFLSDTDSFDVQKIYKDFYMQNQNMSNPASILNLENVLCAEIYKNAVPVYIEMTTSSKLTSKDQLPVRLINASHTFRGTAYIRNILHAALSDVAQLDVKDRNKILTGQIPKEAIRRKSISDLLSDNTNDSKEFLKVFEQLFGVPLTKDFIQRINASNKKAVIENVIFKIAEIFPRIAKSSEAERDIEIEQALKDSFLSPRSFYRADFVNLTQTIADSRQDSPITIIKNAEGKSIPIFRLESTLFEDQYLIHNLKKNAKNRAFRNFLIGNPHVLSNVNNPSAKGQVIKNIAYQGTTGLRLETISDKRVNPANNSSMQEAYINSFIGDFLGLGSLKDGHILSVQLMTLSDKSSIFTKLINLDAIVDSIGLGESKITFNKSLNDLSNRELEQLYYYYRKNQVVDEIFHIITTYNELFNMNLAIPDLNIELANSGEMLPETSDFIKNAWQAVKDEFRNRGLDKKGAAGIEQTLRVYLENHPDSNLNLIRELHYSFYKGVTTLNKNIYLHYKQVRSKRAFDNQINDYVNKNFASQELQMVNAIIKKNPVLSQLLKDYCEQHKLSYNADAVTYDTLKRKLMFEAFFRSQIMDLHFKGPQMDVVKNIRDYDEEIDPDGMSVIEADARFKAAGKRTVDLPGTKQMFAQGLINGVSPEINVAHIEEPKEEVWSPSGQVESGLEILNGSGRISYIYAMMESASIPGAPFKGVNRKTLGEHVGDYSSTLYKWAEYLVNNWHMRNSEKSVYSLSELTRKMHDIPFNEEIDLTKNLFGKPFQPKQANNRKPVYFAKGLHYYRLDNMQYLGNNTYNLSYTEVDKHGDELVEQYRNEDFLQTQNVQINSLWDLYNVIGGIESMELSNTGELTYSDNSLNMLYNYVINVGSIIDTNASSELNQSTVRQPLREKFIAVAASDSGLKRGVTNLNNKSVYTDKHLPLLTSKASTSLFGVQMDVYHHVDQDSTATEPTQTLAALATNGNTREEANEVYTAIASIIQNNMRAISVAANIDYNEENAFKIVQDLTKDIIKTINEKGTDLQQAIVDLCQTYLGVVIPISDTAFYNAFHSFNIQQLNKLALRRKYSGLGGVLNPSGNTFQVFSIGGQTVTYDDLINKAREYFEDDKDALGDFSTGTLVNLYLVTQSDYGKNEFGTSVDLFEHFAIDALQGIAGIVAQNAAYRETEFTDFWDFDETVACCGHKIQQGMVEPLDTIFYAKNNHYYKTELNTAEKYFNFVNDPEIQEVYLDITTPADLKPQIVKYNYDGETHSLYDSDAGDLSYILTSLSDTDLEEALQEMNEQGLQNEQLCKLK